MQGIFNILYAKYFIDVAGVTFLKTSSMVRPSSTDKIKQILGKHGVGEAQQIKTVSSTLDIANVDSRQKFSDERNWTNEQLAKLVRHFHEP